MKLLLVTSCYPYQPGEEFLETEIEIMSGNFQDIYIFPVVADRTRFCRPVPENCRVFPASCTTGSILLHNFFSPVFLNYLFHGLREIAPKTVQNCKWVLRQYLHALKIISGLKGKVEIDVVYSYWANWNAFVALLLHKKFGSGILASRAHGCDIYAERSALKKLPWQSRVLKHAAVFFPCSKNGVDYLAARYRFPSSKVKASYLGVRVSDGISPTVTGVPLHLLSCSYVVPVKRLHLLIETLSHVKRDVNWTHIGDGPQMERIKCLAQGLPSHITPVFIGKLENFEVLDFYRKNSVDLFINVSELEGIPVSIMEAMSFGIPVLATSVGGVAEIVRAPYGKLIPKDFSPVDLAEIIDRYRVPNSEQKKCIRDYQIEKFSVKNYVDFYIKLKGVGQK